MSLRVFFFITGLLLFVGCKPVNLPFVASSASIPSAGFRSGDGWNVDGGVVLHKSDAEFLVSPVQGHAGDGAVWVDVDVVSAQTYVVSFYIRPESVATSATYAMFLFQETWGEWRVPLQAPLDIREERRYDFVLIPDDSGAMRLTFFGFSHPFVVRDFSFSRMVSVNY